MKKLTLKEFNKIYSKVPRLCVDVLVRDETGRILLTRRAIPPAKGLWHIPGGTVLRGETIEQAVKRVAKDELGIDVEILGMTEQVIEYFSPKTTAGGHSVGLPYHIRIKYKDRKKIKLNKEAMEYDYFSNIPPNTIQEQKIFLKKNYGCKLMKN